MCEFDADALRELRDIVVTGVGEFVPEGGNTPCVILPDGYHAVNLAEFVHNDRSPNPIRKKGTVQVFDADSFSEYWTAMFDEHSRIFADETRSKVLAILDYHGSGDNAPRWCQHRIELSLRHSEEWNTWTARNGLTHKMNQMDFGEFIEDNAPDVIRPDGATMLEVARTLSAKTDVDFSSAIRMNNGSVQLKYNEQVKGTYGNGQVEVPESFTIGIPVYIGCERVSIVARLRYRIAAGKLTFWYDLLRHDAIKRDAFLSVRKDIADKLKVAIINGTPA